MSSVQKQKGEIVQISSSDTQEPYTDRERDHIMSSVEKRKKKALEINSKDTSLESYSDRDSDQTSLKYQMSPQNAHGSSSGHNSERDYFKSHARSCKTFKLTSRKYPTRNATSNSGNSNKKRKLPLRPTFPSQTYCHLCRSKFKNDYLSCSQCSFTFCSLCLLKRHGENVHEESGPGLQWVCPKCRPGCGPGCRRNCCTCSQCRRSQGLKPAGSFAAMQAAIQATGFTNMHDYLIHQKTKESAEDIAKRKCSTGWTKAGRSRTITTEVITNLATKDQCLTSDQKGSDRRRKNESDVSARKRINESIGRMVCGSKRRKNTTFCCKEDNLSKVEKEYYISEAREKSLYAKTKHVAGTSGFDSRTNEKGNRDQFPKGGDLGHTPAEGSDIDTTEVSMRDPFELWGDLAINIYLMSIWFSREKSFTENRLSINLTNKEVDQVRAIKLRSNHSVFAYNLESSRLVNRTHHEQQSMRQRLKAVLKKELAEYKIRFAKEYKRIVTEDIPQVKKDADQEMERIIKAVEKAVQPILCAS